MSEMRDGPKILKHELYGEVRFNVVVQTESDCGNCFHNKVCRMAMAEFCRNYTFGNSEFKGCASCSLRFTRYHDEPIPCFSCKHEAPRER